MRIHSTEPHREPLVCRGLSHVRLKIRKYSWNSLRPSQEPGEKQVGCSWRALRAGSGHTPNNQSGMVDGEPGRGAGRLLCSLWGHISPNLKVELPIQPLRASPERITMLPNNLVVSQKNVKYTKRGGSADTFHS